MAKKFNYKGKTIEEIKVMSLDEFIKLLPSNLRRTMLREGWQVKNFMKKLGKSLAKNKPIKTQMREIPVLPAMIGSRIKIYNGKEWVEISVIPEMLGHRLGEFSIPIKMVKHSGPGIGATRGSKSVELK
ncbi:30S ribosomal protein S19 [uncultured archaeon]|nr:30S ribosomal protein S19 [uncultured archaeon]